MSPDHKQLGFTSRHFIIASKTLLKYQINKTQIIYIAIHSYRY